VPQEGRDLLTGAYLGPNPPHMNVTVDRQTTDGRATAYSKREHEFTFAKNAPQKILLLLIYYSFS